MLWKSLTCFENLFQVWFEWFEIRNKKKCENHLLNEMKIEAENGNINWNTYICLYVKNNIADGFCVRVCKANPRNKFEVLMQILASKNFPKTENIFIIFLFPFYAFYPSTVTFFCNSIMGNLSTVQGLDRPG